MKRSLTLSLVIVLLVFPIISSITGDVSQNPTNVSVYVQPGPPVIYINSPANTTYPNTNIILNYSIRNNISQVWYRLNNGVNTSLTNLSENSLTINTVEGFHTLFLYANNTIGESTKSVSFTISNQVQPPGNPPNNGGGGGSGDSSITAFTIEKNLIEMSVFQGEAKTNTIKIKNIGDSKITITITKESLDVFAISHDNNITLNPGETKDININFFVPSETLPNVYFGRIVFQSGTFKQYAVAVLEVKQKQALFDINVQILPNYKTTSQGKKISSIIDLTNIGLRGTAVDVELTLYLTNEYKGRISEISKETLAVKDNLTITRKLQVPNDILPGTYFLIADLKYNNISASSYDSFNVEFGKSSNLWWIILLIILILILCIIIIKVIYSYEKKIEKKSKSKGRSFYKPFVKEED